MRAVAAIIAVAMLPLAAAPVQAGSRVVGSLRLQMTGLPSGVDAQVSFVPRRGSAASVMIGARSSVVSGVPKGAYRVVVGARYADGFEYTATARPARIKVSGKKRAKVRVTYRKAAAAPWQETDWCSRLKPITSLVRRFDPGNPRPALAEILRRRYPPGVAFLDAAPDARLPGWLRDDPARTFGTPVANLPLIVHEGTHGWELSDGRGRRIVDDSRILPPLAMDTFDRSEILTRHPFRGADSYADLYLTGDAGAQGFDTVLNEFNAYTHDLATAYCLRDVYATGSQISKRDAVLTWMLYTEIYLKLAREQHPQDYAKILAVAVPMIREIWQRAEFYLAATDAYPGLGMADGKIAKYVYAPEYLSEYQALPAVP